MFNFNRTQKKSTAPRLAQWAQVEDSTSNVAGWLRRGYTVHQMNELFLDHEIIKTGLQSGEIADEFSVGDTAKMVYKRGFAVLVEIE